jgi:hypothetical protein
MDEDDYMNGTELLKALGRADNVYAFIQTTDANWSTIKLDHNDTVREVEGIIGKRKMVQFKARWVRHDIYIG